MRVKKSKKKEKKNPVIITHDTHSCYLAIKLYDSIHQPWWERYNQDY